MNDPFGQAIADYFNHGNAPDIKINTNYTEDESIPVSYLFRTEEQMPELEKLAIERCKGKVLDVGAAAGCHSLILQNKGFLVTALEKSTLAAETIKKRNIEQVITADIFDYSDDKYDSILLLMNGAGIGGTVNGLRKLLLHLKTLLAEGGRILLDSSDIKYLFEEEDGSVWMDIANEAYYGEMQYEASYEGLTNQFDWLFIDAAKLKQLAEEIGFRFELVAEGEHFDYLAQLNV